jgi:hypothetical protein
MADGINDYSRIEECLKTMNGGGASGGCAPFEDMMYFEKIDKTEGVVYHHSDWRVSTKYPSEETQIIILMRSRKVGG